MTILEAMNDGQMFAPFFRGESWNAWRAHLAAKRALPMTPEQFDIFKACTGRTRPPRRPVSRAVTVVGRRGGKDAIEGLEAAYDAAFIDYRPFLSPGEFLAIVLLAVDRKQAGVLFSRVEALFDNVPMLRRLVTNRTRESLELGDRRVIVNVMTASHRSTRGYTAGRVTLNECAFMRDESSANPDQEIVRALEPAMATIPTATLTLMSTPYSRSGLLWKWFDRWWGEDRDDVLVWRAPTHVMNPTVPSRVIEKAYEDDPLSAAAEFGAEFRTDVASFIDADAVDGATVPGCYERPPAPGVSYVAFVDPSGGRHDSMVLAIASHNPMTGVTSLDCIRERKPAFSPAAVCREFAETMRSYGVTSCLSDRWGGAFVQEQLATCGIQANQCAEPKSEIYLKLLPLLNSGRIELLDNRRLRLQLCALERRTSKSGKDAVAEPPRAHDDVANAAAGALVAAHLETPAFAVPDVAGFTRASSPWADGARIVGSDL